MASEFLDEEEAADHAHPRAGAAARSACAATRAWSITGCAGSGKTMLAVEHAKRLAAKGKRRALRLLQPRACATTCASASEGLGRRLQHLPRALPRARAAGRGRRCPSTDAGEAPPEYFWTTSCPTRSSRRDRARSAPQYDALLVDEAQDLEQRLARRADAARCATRGGARSGCSWTTTSASTRSTLDVPRSSAPSTSPSTAATRRRSTAR